MLEIKDICYSVMVDGKKKIILDHISFAVKEGELAVITGQNGSGKSTLEKNNNGNFETNKRENFI